MLRIAVSLALAGTTLANAQEASAQAKPAATSLPDGRYTCQIWIGSMLSTMGHVDVKGRSYRGPSHTPSGPFRPLQIDGSGKMTWEPNFSQLKAAGATITGSRVSGTAAKPAFRIDYTTARGYREAMDCTRQ